LSSAALLGTFAAVNGVISAPCIALGNRCVIALLIA
jgi:hypothetical protein